MEKRMSSTVIKKHSKKDNVKTRKSSNELSVLPNWETISTAVKGGTNNELPSGYGVYHSYNSTLW